MHLKSLLESPAELTSDPSRSEPIVISTRIRLARNLSKHAFPGRASQDVKREVRLLCEQALTELPDFEDAIVAHAEDLEPLDKQVLIERHLVSPELTNTPESSAVISKKQDVSVMINEEDHIRLQGLSAGLNLQDTWKSIDALDTSLETKLEYAFSTRLGYLTACPTNLGTAMRASAMMHLPALVISEQMEKVVRAVNQLGLAVRGLFGEGSDAGGSIFQISNQQTLGESEQSILNRLSGVLNTIIEQERNARKKLLETDRAKLLDKIGRAFGILKNAYVVPSSESMNLLSLMRLACDLNMLPETERSRIDRLFIESQPGHIQGIQDMEISPEDRDAARADFLRKSFASLDSLSFDKLS